MKLVTTATALLYVKIPSHFFCGIEMKAIYLQSKITQHNTQRACFVLMFHVI